MKTQLTRFALTFAAVILMLVIAGPAVAETQTFHDQSPFSILVPCANGGTGELVEGIAKINAVLSSTEDGAGGFHVHINLKFRGAGLGTVTGDTYRYHADIPEIFIDRLNETAGGAFNAAITYRVDVIGTGDAPTFSVDGHAQITVNANGVVTMEKGDFTLNETCR